MNPRESALDSLLDEFASEQTESVDYYVSETTSNYNTFPSFSSFSSTFNFALSSPILSQLLPSNPAPVPSSVERMTSSSSAASTALANASDDSIQLQNLLKRTRRIMHEYEAAHRTFQSNSTLAILTHTKPGNKPRTVDHVEMELNMSSN